MHTRSIDFNNSSSIPSHSGPPYNDHHSFEPSFEQAHRHMRAAENSVYSRDHATPAHHSANTPSGSTRVFCPLMARPPEPAEQHSLSRPHITSPVRFPGTIPDYPAAIAPLNRSSLNQLVHPPPVHAHPIAAAQPPPQVPIAPPAAALPPPKVPVAPPAAPLPPQQAPVAPPAPIAPPAPSPSRAHTLETHVDELSNKADARKSESDEEDLPDPKRIKLSTSKSKSKGAPRGRVSTKGRAGSPIQGESGAQETKLDVGSGAGRSWTKQDDGRLIGYITDFNNPERFKYAEKGIKKGFWDEVSVFVAHRLYCITNRVLRSEITCFMARERLALSKGVGSSLNRCIIWSPTSRASPVVGVMGLLPMETRLMSSTRSWVVESRNTKQSTVRRWRDSRT